MVNTTPFVIVPLYLYPSSGAWSPLYTQIQAQPSVDFQVVVNIDSGPGATAYPDSDWISTLTTLNSYDNVQLIGYVPTNYAGRNITQVEQDVATYADWAQYTEADISVTGIFFDEAPDTDDSTTLSYMESIAAYAHSEFSAYSDRVVTFNPGAPVADAYYDYADQIIVFEDVYSNFQISSSGYPLADVSSDQRASSTIMINDFPDQPKKQKSFVNQLTALGYTGIWISTENDYAEFSELFTNLCTQMAAATS